MAHERPRLFIDSKVRWKVWMDVLAHIQNTLVTEIQKIVPLILANQHPKDATSETAL